MQAEERLAVCFMSARAVRRDATQATPITRLEMFSQHNNVAISGPRQQTNFVQCEERQDERLDLDLCGFSHCAAAKDVGLFYHEPRHRPPSSAKREQWKRNVDASQIQKSQCLPRRDRPWNSWTRPGGTFTEANSCTVKPWLNGPSKIAGPLTRCRKEPSFHLRRRRPQFATAWRVLQTHRA